MWSQRNKILTVIVGVVGSIFLFNYFLSSPEDTSNEIAINKNNIDNVKANKVVRAQDNKITLLTTNESGGNQSAPLVIDASNQSQCTSSQDDSSKASKMNVPGNCPDCIDRILAFLSAPYNNEAEKIKATKNWIKPETTEETLSLLELVKEAHALGQNELKDRLLQVLAGVDSNESTDVLISLIKGEVPGLTFQELPEELQYAIQKAIKLNPDNEWTGQVLAESNIYQSSPETIENLQNVDHPMMLYYQAQEANQRRETEQLEHIVTSLQTMEDSRSLEVIMRLGKDNIIAVDDATKAAHEWVDSHHEIFEQDHYESYLSEPNATPAVRSIAAVALSASNDPNLALISLKKAYDNELDPDVRFFYEKAMDNIITMHNL